MKAVSLNKVFIILISLLILTFIGAIFFVSKNTQKNEIKDEKTSIFEIKDTQSVNYFNDFKEAKIYKNYMIIKPPNDYNELKLLIQKYLENNPIDMEIAKDELRRTRNIEVQELNKIDVKLDFFKESTKSGSNFNRNWQPFDNFIFIDRIEEHYDDTIATIYLTKNNPHINYIIWRRSVERADYGELKETISYIDNNIEKREIIE